MEISRFDIDYKNEVLYMSVDAGEGNTIAAIKVDTCGTFNCQNEASTKAVTVYNGNEQTLVDQPIYLNMFHSLSRGLYFFYFYVNDAEAGMSSMRVVYDAQTLQRTVFNAIKRDMLPCNKCSKVSEDVINKVMLFFGFKEALEAKEYRYACDFINAIYDGGNVTTSNCGCHGR